LMTFDGTGKTEGWYFFVVIRARPSMWTRRASQQKPKILLSPPRWDVRCGDVGLIPHPRIWLGEITWIVVSSCKSYPLVICYIAIEHGHRNSWFIYDQWEFSIAISVYQRVTHVPQGGMSPGHVECQGQRWYWGSRRAAECNCLSAGRPCAPNRPIFFILIHDQFMTTTITTLTLKVRPDLFEPSMPLIERYWKLFRRSCFFVRFQNLSQRGQGLSTAKAGRAAEGQFMVSTLLRNAGSVDLCGSLHSCDALMHCCTDRQDQIETFEAPQSLARAFHSFAESLAQDLWAKIRAEQNRHNTYVPQKKHVYTQTYIFRTYVYIYILYDLYVYRYTHTRINTHKL
jgi:hypothetical protein